MLSFATEFPVRPTSSAQFVKAVQKWITGSPHTSLTADQLASIPNEGSWKVSGDSVSLEAILVREGESETASFKYRAVDGHLEWVTEVTYSKSELDDWVGIRTDRESSRLQISLPPAKKPLLIRTLLSELGGGLDDELHVSDTPYRFGDSDVSMAVRLLNADAENYLPLVYVSCPFTGQSIVNPEPLARSLGGMAHVIVEPSRLFSRSIQRDVGSRNVYGGSVGVYWPNGEKFRYYLNETTPTEFDIRRAIIADIRAALINRRPLVRCTWSRAEALLARSAFEALRKSGSEDVSEYVAAFDFEMNATNKQLQDAEEEVLRLKGQLRTTKDRGSSAGAKWDIGSEQQLRTGEFDEILRDALNSAAQNAQDDSRRQHVLYAAAAELPQSDHLKQSRDDLKKILKNYSSMSGNMIVELKEIGFDVTEDGKHYKLTYMQDDRYVFALPKSGSDWRGGMNAVSDIAKRVF